MRTGSTIAAALTGAAIVAGCGAPQASSRAVAADDWTDDEAAERECVWCDERRPCLFVRTPWRSR